jgi:polar amino acid transport system permease protein
MGYTWDFSPVYRNFDLLLAGLANTVELTALSYLIGLVLGGGLAFLRLSKRRALSLGAGLYIDFFRGTPGLVQLFWFFFALPGLTGIRLSPYAASLLTLTVLASAFLAEVFRAGIVSVERGQWEAARAIGMSEREAMRRIILPQAIKRMIPVFLERLVELLKMSTIASTISYADILYQAQDLSQKTYRPLEIFTAAAVMILVVITIASQLTRLVERRMARSGETTAR